MKSDNYQTFLQGKIVAICESIINEEIGIIAGSRRLVSLYHEIFDNEDSDFRLFIAIESETDHLPVDFERKNWSLDALKRKDLEIDLYEKESRHETVLACKKLISTFVFRE
jgi:Protein of unknown function (DUF2489)